MSIRVECAGCKASLIVRASLAGKEGTCPNCGYKILVPDASSSARLIATSSLQDATAPDVVAEFTRRGVGAVLVTFDTPPSREYDLCNQPTANVRCFHSGDMNDAQMMEVLEHVGRMSQGWRGESGAACTEPYDLKGDRLGMSLEDFRAKYNRTEPGLGQVLPYSSDRLSGDVHPELLFEAWHNQAGVVHARIDLPVDNKPPTIAGVKLELLLYQFVDGQLFRTTAMFDTEVFHQVHEALASKYGRPNTENKELMRFGWDNGVSAIALSRGSIRPKRASIVHFVHHQLMELVESRKPNFSDDI